MALSLVEAPARPRALSSTRPVTYRRRVSERHPLLLDFIDSGGGVQSVRPDTLPGVVATVELRVFQPCRQQAAVSLRLLVDGEDLVLQVCHRHAEWLAVYAEADAATRVIDRVPMAQSSRPRGDLPGTHP